MVTKNDKRVLREVKLALEEFDGYAPHGGPDWTGVRRLLRAGLIRSVGVMECQSCWAPHETECFELTKAGRRETAGWAL